MDNVPLQQRINRIPILKYRYRGSFPSDYISTLDSDTFANINTQPSNLQGEHLIMIANSRQKLYFADSVGRKKYSFLKQQYGRMMPVHYSPIAVFAVSPRSMPLFISSNSDKKNLQEFKISM